MVGPMPTRILEDKISPNGEYFIRVYLNGNGSTYDFSITYDLYRVNPEKIMRTIYSLLDETFADVYWVDSEICVINGKRLNVFKDRYKPTKY